MTTLDRLAARYTGALEDRLGVDVTRAQPEVLTFHALEQNFWVFLRAGNPELLRLRCSFSPIDGMDHATLIGLCHEVSVEFPVAKATVTEQGGFTVSAEMLVAGPGQLPEATHLAAVLPAALHVLSAAADSVLLRIRFHHVTTQP